MIRNCIAKPRNLQNILTRTFSSSREWFFCTDTKGFLYMEDTEPKIFPNALKDKKFLNMFYANLEPNKLGKHQKYGWYSKCWGEYNFLRCPRNVPLIFHHLNEGSEGGATLTYSVDHEVVFDPKNVRVTTDGTLYYVLKVDWNEHLTRGILSSQAALELSEKITIDENGNVCLTWNDEKVLIPKLDNVAKPE